MSGAMLDDRWRKWGIGAGLFCTLALAAALRFVGLRWGLPNELHSYSYHPDEFLTIGAAFVSIYCGKSLITRFYNYPSLYLYLSALAVAVALGYGVKATDANIYLIPRVVTALMGVGAVAVTYWTGRRLYGAAVGLIAAVILAVAPLHAQHSHFATVDVPCTLFVAAALGYAGLILNRGNRRDYLLGGAMAGLAAGTKYNAGLVLLSMIAAHFLRSRSSRGSPVRLLLSIGCAVAAFVISTPGVIFRTKDFLYGFTYELHHAAEGHGLVFAGTGSGFVYTFMSSLWYGLGMPLAILFAISVISALWKRDRTGLVILAFALPYYVLISLSQVRFARYALPLFPAAALLCAWLVQAVWVKLNSSRVSPLRWVWAVLVANLILSNLVGSLMLDSFFTGHDPRDAAARWVFSHVPESSRIGVMDVPWFFSPPLSEDLGFGTLGQRREAARKAPYDLVIFSDFKKPGGWSTESSRPDWVITSDYEVGDSLRLRNVRSISLTDRRKVDRILADLDLVEKLYVRRTRFGFLDRFPGGIPHDMRYAYPAITIYERR